MSPIVEIRNLDFAYGKTVVLEQINLQIARGGTLGVIGPNGGGKTTLVKLMLGLLDPGGGSILIDRLSPHQAVARGDIVGYLPQRPATPMQFPITVRQLVRSGLAGKSGMLRAVSKDELAFADELIDRVGLCELADASISSLSGGQLQRALIARSLAPRPRLLLLDEPMTGIDRAGQQQFVELIVGLKRELDLTLVIVSHDLRTVSAMCDRVACLQQALHYHDVPDHLPPELIFRMFACDAEAMGLGHVHTKDCGHAPAAAAVASET